MSVMPQDYYNNFDPTKNYDRILYRDGYTLQGAELNEAQSAAHFRLKSVTDALFKDGDIIRDAQIVINATTGEVQAQSGAVYIGGAVRGVPAATFSVPTTGTVVIGVRLTERVISELDDASLYNPAIGSRDEGEPGAHRLQVTPSWGFDGDGHATGEFYPVYAVDDGIMRPKEAPPTLDAFTQGIAKYDRDSTAGGSYVVDGLLVAEVPETGAALDKAQVFTVSAGRARVNGYGVELATDRRLRHETAPDLRLVDTEVHVATGDATQRIDVAHPPIAKVSALRVTRRKTVQIVHGAYAGVLDALPDTAVVALVECKQGDTVYVNGSDYKKTGDRVDWSPQGAEPAAGSTYDCTYDFVTALEPEALDADGFDVAGAVAGSSIMVTYQQALPRLDRLCLTQDGTFQWIQGVAAEVNPRTPAVPATLLALATIQQTWRPTKRVTSDGVRVVPFDEISAINRRIDYVLGEVARQRLEADVFTRESGARVGLFVDPLLDDSMRDQGLEQTAAIVDGELVLPIAGGTSQLSVDIVKPAALAYTPVVLLDQPRRTGSMAVNPYMAYEPLPARITLTPPVDFWTITQSKWTSPITQVFSSGSGNRASSSTSTSTNVVGSTTEQIAHLRPITLRFDVEGFGPEEVVRKVIFDGIEVPFEAISL